MTGLSAVAVLFLLQGYEAVEEREPSAPFERTAVDLLPRLWFASLRGDILASDDGLPGDELDLRGDLDLDGTEGVGSGRLRIQTWEEIRIGFDYWTGNFEGEKTAGASFRFGGSLFAAGSTVETDLEMSLPTLSVGLPFELLNEEPFAIEAEAGLGLKYFHMVAELESTGVGPPLEEEVRERFILPVITLRGSLRVGGWGRVEVYVSGLRLSGVRDADVAIVEGGIDLGAEIYSGFYVTAGYHVFSLEAEQNLGDEELVVGVFGSGFTFGLGYNF